jgi:hypothetical protein
MFKDGSSPSKITPGLISKYQYFKWGKVKCRNSVYSENKIEGGVILFVIV